MRHHLEIHFLSLSLSGTGGSRCYVIRQQISTYLIPINRDYSFIDTRFFTASYKSYALGEKVSEVIKQYAEGSLTAEQERNLIMPDWYAKKSKQMYKKEPAGNTIIRKKFRQHRCYVIRQQISTYLFYFHFCHNRWLFFSWW